MGGGEVIKEGWLVKSPPLEGGGIKVWRKRYFKLRSSKVLEYYKSEDADQQKGVINLEDCTSVHSDLSHKKYKYVFDVETRTRVFYLVAQNQQEMKQWVDVLCRVCGLTVHQEEDVPPSSPAASNYGSHCTSSGSSTLMPTITPPIYSTTPGTRSATLGSQPSNLGGQTSNLGGQTSNLGGQTSNLGGQTAFNDRFHPSKGPPVESMYTLAHAAETDVQRELGQEQQVPAGVPLMEALATKGIGPRTSSLSSASGGDALTGHASDSNLSPCHEPSARRDGSGNEYVPHPQRSEAFRPTPKPRASTMVPLSERLSASDISGSSGGNPRMAETLQNGYMKPRQVQNPPPNYDQLPPGPPRPAPSPRHRSALLREDSSGSNNVAPSGHTYINMQRSLDSQIPPPVIRSNKPQEPSPPKVNRQLKPEESQCAADDPETPPSCPVRISSLSASMNKSMDLNSSGSEQQLTRATASSTSVDDDGGEGFVGFSEGDLPRRSRSTMKYTQIQFNGASGNPSLVEPSSQIPEDDEMSRRQPVPAPRPGVSRVNYSDVDLSATRARALAAESGKVQTIQVNLADAERQSLKEKPYINVKRDGVVDDASDPDYYTYMRSQVYDQALDAYNTTEGEFENSEEFPEGNIPVHR